MTLQQLVLLPFPTLFMFLTTTIFLLHFGFWGNFSWSTKQLTFAPCKFFSWHPSADATLVVLASFSSSCERCPRYPVFLQTGWLLLVQFYVVVRRLSFSGFRLLQWLVPWPRVLSPDQTVFFSHSWLVDTGLLSLLCSPVYCHLHECSQQQFYHPELVIFTISWGRSSLCLCIPWSCFEIMGPVLTVEIFATLCPISSSFWTELVSVPFWWHLGCLATISAVLALPRLLFVFMVSALWRGLLPPCGGFG